MTFKVEMESGDVLERWDAWLTQPSFAHILAHRAETRPTDTAYVFLGDGETETESLTYGALDARARAIAARLQQASSRGDRALLAYLPGLEFVEAFFGCLYAGLVAVPAPPPQGKRSLVRFGELCADAAPAFILGTQASLREVKEAAAHEPSPAATTLVEHESIDTDSDAWQTPSLAQDSLAFLQYTSGSTSAPRGVMITHGNMLHNMGSITYGLGLQRGDHYLNWLPHFHDMGLAQAVLLPMYAGCRGTILSPAHFLQTPSRWLGTMARLGATHSGAPNFAFELSVRRTSEKERADMDLRSVKVLLSGAEPIRRSTVDTFNAAFAPVGLRPEALTPAYGLAENTVAVSLQQHDAVARMASIRVPKDAESCQYLSDSPDDETRSFMGCGGPLPNQEIRIVDPTTGRPVATSTIGEIWLAGPSAGTGYWRKPDATMETFGARLESEPDKTYVRTGDLGFIQDGEVHIAGRLKDLIVIHGRNHYPQDIEATVDQCHALVRPGCVAAFSTVIEDRELVAVVCECADTEGDASRYHEVCETIRRAVAEEHGIDVSAVALIAPGSVAKTSSGKIQRHRSRRDFEGNRLRSLYVHTFSGTDGDRTDSTADDRRTAQDIAQYLRGRIAGRLGLDENQIGSSTPFSSFGLSSLAIVDISRQLQDWLGCPLSPTLVYDYPTIATLSEYLSNRTHRAPGITDREPGEPLAIVGMACRFPGAPNLDAYWQLLIEGREAIGEVPSWRWDGDAHHDPEMSAPYRIRTKRGGFLDEIRDFDAAFFNIPPREAALMDPQQRLMLEVAWEALEHAAIDPSSLAGSNTGVYVGVGPIDYINLMVNQAASTDAYSATGSSGSIVSNRISYLLDLQGPSASIDTACSSSLVALHQACQALRNGECRTAIVGAVNAILSPMPFFVLSEARMLSPDGRCKAFDASADGYVRSEGCGSVIVKRLRDAVADGDEILAVIRGSAINHVGKSNGLTAPSSRAQRAVIEAAIHDAQVDPARIDYIEAHGTGTSLGDPIEMEALRAVLLPNRGPEDRCWVGSAKTNVGHLETAAGMAGLIKTVLALQHQQIPPHLHVQELNPLLEIENTPIRIPMDAQPWTCLGEKRLAGVSAFGFGGANGHVILEEAPAAAQEQERSSGPELFTLSAKTSTALHQLAGLYGGVANNGDIDLSRMCRTANAGRAHHAHRAALIIPEDGNRREALVAGLQALAAGEPHEGLTTGTVPPSHPTPRIAMLFTGQGAQYAEMGRGLYDHDAGFHATLTYCSNFLAEDLEVPLLEVLFGASTDLLNETVYTQPALFVLEYALAEAWISRGIQPEAVLGHSVGEFAAACIAGAFSLDDGLKLIAARGRLIQSVREQGAMAAVFAARDAVESWLAPFNGRLVVATVNAPELVVVSGDATALDELLRELARQEVRTSRLAVSHAFHSPHMDGVLDAFEAIAAEITYRPLALPLASNVTGEMVPAGTVLTPDYWRRHIREAVLFSDGMAALQEMGCTGYLEIGPSNTLIGMGRRAIADNGAFWVASLSPRKPDRVQMLESAATLYVNGATLHWDKVSGTGGGKMRLPSYPFERKRFWFVPQHEGFIWQTGRGAGSPAVSTRTLNQQAPAPAYELAWEPVEKLSDPAGTGVWLLVTTGGAAGEAIAAALRSGGAAVYTVRPGTVQSCDGTDLTVRRGHSDDFAACLAYVTQQAFGGIRGIVDGRALEGPLLGTSTCIEQLTEEWLPVLADMLADMNAESSDESRPPYWVLTRSAVATGAEGEPADPIQSSVWGLVRSVLQEKPGAFYGLADIDDTEAGVLATLGDMLTAAADAHENQLAYRGNQGWLAARLRQREPEGTLWSARPDGTYLLTGGFGALGLRTAEWLVDCGARHLLLCGRTVPPPRSAWKTVAPDDPQRVRIEAVQALERRGAAVRWAAWDSGDDAGLAALLETEQNELQPPIRGLFHLAGVLDDRMSNDIDADSLRRVFLPKAIGAWNLHRAFLDADLDCFVLYSSAASMMGSGGQANYAAANGFLDSLASSRRYSGLPATSVNWGPWAEGGMAEGALRGERMERQGIRMLGPAAALRALAEILVSKTAQAAVMDMDWSAVTGRHGTVPPLLSHIATAPAGVSIAADVGAILEGVSEERPGRVTEYVCEIVGKTLGTEASQIDPHVGFVSQGLDSIMLLDIVRHIERDLGLRIHMRELFDHASIGEFAQYVATELDIAQGRKRGEAAPEEGFLDVAVSAMAATPYLPIARKNPRCVFVLSAPRSGSTLLRVMLAGHPGLFSPPELHLLHFQSMGDRATVFGTGHSVGAGLQRALMELRGITADEAYELDRQLTEENTPVQEIYGMLQDGAAPRLLVDKSPSYGGRLETLQRAEEMFEDPLYIYLYRHPYAAIESYMRNRTGRMFDFGHADHFLLAQEVWTLQNKNIDAFTATVDPKRVFRVRYEELVREPDDIMASMCAFLDMPFARQVLNPYDGGRMTDGARQDENMIGDPNFWKHDKIDSSLADVWRQIELPGAVSLATQDMAKRLGYDLPREGAGEDAPETDIDTEALEDLRL